MFGSFIRGLAQSIAGAVEDALGIKTRIITWHTAGDERVCPLCRSREGISIRISSLSQGTFQPYFFDNLFDEQSGKVVQAHPNCRCPAYASISYE